jgi:hypothetical protein
LLFHPGNIFKLHKIWIKSKEKPKDLFLSSADSEKVFNSIKIGKYPKLTFNLEGLFPGSETDAKQAKKFGLDKFLLLSIPVFERYFELKTDFGLKAPKSKLQATLFDISYILGSPRIAVVATKYGI